MGYYLLDNPNPHGDHFYRSRRRPLRVIVLHITASVEDQDMRGGDVSAEQTARYAASTDREVSWHAGADSDSWLELLPPGFTAWHVRNYNSGTWGLEISKRDTSWSDEPRAWVEATLRNAADACRPVVAKYGIPPRLLTKAQVDAGMTGYTYHSRLDPERRTDPGADFPINRFFDFLEDDMPSAEEIAEATVRKLLNRDVVDRPGDNPGNQDWTVKHIWEGTFRRATWGHMAAHDGLVILRELAKREGCEVDEQAIVRGVLAGLAESGVTPDGIADELAEAFPPELARQVVDEWGRRLHREESTS